MISAEGAGVIVMLTVAVEGQFPLVVNVIV